MRRRSHELDRNPTQRAGSPTRPRVAALVDRGGPPGPDPRHRRRPDAADAARARRRRHGPLELLRRPLRPHLPLDPLHLGLDLRREGDEADDQGRTIRDFHTEIKGTDDHGRRYHALDPEIFWWAHATFTWEFFRAHELYFPGPLSRGPSRSSSTPRPSPGTAATASATEPCRRPSTTSGPASTRSAAHELELTPAVPWVLDPDDEPWTGRTAGPSRPALPLDGLAARFGSEVLRLLVYGCMPDRLRRRFDFPWSNGDRLKYARVCAALQLADPAIRRGAMSNAWPEGTPHLDHRVPGQVIVAGPSPRRAARG